MAVMSILAPVDAECMNNPRSGDDDPPIAMRLLAAGIPLSLLLDLMSPFGPDSERIAALERASSR
jgi:hypothetical protein